ncbi:MAG: right-handed parallel beta-helix repeat-containing protein [Acidobacteria bacterium]|mgnify:CR=1 FL=1|nr:right-handed parallel beta-helix repeat-containing protein [Acidobacteriota bacterium]
MTKNILRTNYLLSYVNRIVLAVVSLALLAFAAACNSEPNGQSSTAPVADFQKKLQEDLIKAKPGAVIELPEGKFSLDKTLSLKVDKVTIRGKGMDKTVLSFKGQTAGSAGMLVKANDFVIEDLALEDAAGDALKIEDGTNITIRRVRVEWTGGSKETNGPYGIYPVTCKNVLIEESVAIAASDAGIYVGQSENVIVRRNRAERNVAGIEIENTKHADVYDNIATNNTGGIMAFNMPDLPVQGGGQVRIYNNKIIGNNLANFAPTSQIVASLPTGTGVLVLAIKGVEVFKNFIKDNNTANINIATFAPPEDKPLKDPNYSPFNASIYIHDNEISGGGKQPDVRLPKIAALTKVAGKEFTDILYDGVIEPKDGKPGTAADAKICIENNGAAGFLTYDAANGFKKIVRDAKAYKCSLPALATVSLPQVSATGGGL